MTGAPAISCSVCAAPFAATRVIGGLRRSDCRACGHSERIDIEPFDYSGFAMGSTGVAEERLISQSEFAIPHLKPGIRALEIGCAAGNLAAIFRARHAFARYDGVELSPARAEALTKLDTVFDAPLSTLLDRGDIARRSYDLAIASHCLEHIDHPGALLDTMIAALAPDGALLIEVPNRSGHPLLPFDDNRSHIHFFSVASLSRLLIDRGFQIVATESGARLDARYPDSLRVLARRPQTLDSARHCLSDHPLLAGENSIVIWGAGRMTDEMLAHYFDPARIAWFIDRDPVRRGTLRLGAPVKAPESLAGEQGRLVLINSIEMEGAIRAQIARDCAGLNLRIVGISALLGG